MIIKITPDKERAESMLELIGDRKKLLSSLDNKFSTIIAENYYEIIKELSIIILLLDGLKTIGENAHKEIIEILSNYKELDEFELRLMDDLRIKRNKSSYEGKKIDINYIINNKQKFLKIIQKLEGLISKKL